MVAETNGHYGRMQRAELKRNRIKEAFKEMGKDVKHTDMKKALSAEGINVSDPDFYGIRKQLFGGTRTAKKSTRRLKQQLSSGIATLNHQSKTKNHGVAEAKISLDDLRQVKDLADRVGGIKQLNTIVGFMLELVSFS